MRFASRATVSGCCAGDPPGRFDLRAQAGLAGQPVTGLFLAGGIAIERDVIAQVEGGGAGMGESRPAFNACDATCDRPTCASNAATFFSSSGRVAWIGFLQAGSSSWQHTTVDETRWAPSC